MNTQDDTYERLRRITLSELIILHISFMKSNKHITLEMSEKFFKSHGWDREEYITSLNQYDRR